MPQLTRFVIALWSFVYLSGCVKTQPATFSQYRFILSEWYAGVHPVNNELSLQMYATSHQQKLRLEFIYAGLLANRTYQVLIIPYKDQEPANFSSLPPTFSFEIDSNNPIAIFDNLPMSLAQFKEQTYWVLIPDPSSSKNLKRDFLIFGKIAF